MTVYAPRSKAIKLHTCQKKGCRYFAKVFTRLPLGSNDPNATQSQITLCGGHFYEYSRMTLPEREKYPTQPPKRRYV